MCVHVRVCMCVCVYMHCVCVPVCVRTEKAPASEPPGVSGRSRCGSAQGSWF